MHAARSMSSPWPSSRHRPSSRHGPSSADLAWRMVLAPEPVPQQSQHLGPRQFSGKLSNAAQRLCPAVGRTHTSPPTSAVLLLLVLSLLFAFKPSSYLPVPSCSRPSSSLFSLCSSPSPYPSLRAPVPPPPPCSSVRAPVPPPWPPLRVQAPLLFAFITSLSLSAPTYTQSHGGVAACRPFREVAQHLLRRARRRPPQLQHRRLRR